MHFPEEHKDVSKKMLQELYKLLTYYRCLILAGALVGAGLFLQALCFSGNGWLRVGIGWFGLSLLAASGWIYINAYRNARQETLFFERILGVPRTPLRKTYYRYYGYISRLSGNLYFLCFLSGLLVSFYFAASMEDKQEEGFFKALSYKVMEQHAATEDAALIQATHVCHEILIERSAVFQYTPEKSLIDQYIHPLSTDLMTANGACGSYSMVLGRVLQVMGFTVRLVQMKVGKEYGGHIILEVQTAHGWVVLDPLYDLYFVRPDGQLASFGDVNSNWRYYALQTPKGYNPGYCYEDARYTNWSKIPVVLPLVKMTLSLFLSREYLDHLSVRTWFLRKYFLLKWVLLAGLLTVSAAIIARLAGWGKGEKNKGPNYWLRPLQF